VKRLLTASLVVGLTVGLLSSPATAKTWHPGNGQGPCSGWFSYVRPSMGVEEVARRTELTIRCAARTWPINVDTALYIGRRESGLWPWAANPSGCRGVFQHQIAYWSGRVHDYIHRDWYSKWRWEQGISVFDMRANVLVSIQMMHAGGWSNWGM